MAGSSRGGSKYPNVATECECFIRAALGCYADDVLALLLLCLECWMMMRSSVAPGLTLLARCASSNSAYHLRHIMVYMAHACMSLATLIDADLQYCSRSLRWADDALNHAHSTHSLSLNSTGHLMDLRCVLLARACAARHLGDTRLLTWAPLALGTCATPHIHLQTTLYSTDAYHGLHDACASGNVGKYLAIS